MQQRFKYKRQASSYHGSLSFPVYLWISAPSKFSITWPLAPLRPHQPGLQSQSFGPDPEYPTHRRRTGQTAVPARQPQGQPDAGRDTSFKRYARRPNNGGNGCSRSWQRIPSLHGEISLYCSVTAATSILPQILGAFRQSHPGVQIKLQTGDAAEALDRLNNRDAQVTIAPCPSIFRIRSSLWSWPARPCCLSPPRKGSCRCWTARRNRLAAHPLIMAEQGLSRIRIDRWFRQKAYPAQHLCRGGGQ